MALQLSFELLHLWNILGHGCTEEVLIIPLGVLLNLIEGPFDLAVTLRITEVIKVMAVTLFVVLNTEQVIKSRLGKGERLIHLIQVVWVHCRHELTN